MRIFIMKNKHFIKENIGCIRRSLCDDICFDSED